MKIWSVILLLLLSGCYSAQDRAYLDNTHQHTSRFIETTWPDPATQDAIVLVQVSLAYRGDGTFNPFSVPGNITSEMGEFDEVDVTYAAEKATAQTFLPGLNQFCSTKGRPTKVLWNKPPTRLWVLRDSTDWAVGIPCRICSV